MPRKKKIEETITPVETPVEKPEIPTQPVQIGTIKDKVLTVEQAVITGFPIANKLPNVRGGICEFCGIIDPKVPSSLQYTLCKHYQGLKNFRCTYCPVDADHDDVRAHRVFSVFEYPPDSGKLTVVCDDMRCAATHIKRFQVNRTI